MPFLWYKKGIFFTHERLRIRSPEERVEPAQARYDFVDAQRLWEDPDLLEIPAKASDEPRSVVIGRIDGKHWSGIITYRGKRIRLISVRRSRSSEVTLYEGP
ncbi:BrnT family toxin [Halomonas sp. LBP4]|uniref:BrnT family toxin n=1 Tax=Halomonas sp. LBP4 TaxID=2044917 RepID=UPI0021AD496D|nr:BrnT family toxin [Halomonas sp. LBP4]